MNVHNKTYDRFIVNQKELNNLSKNLFIELKCTKCHTIIQSDIKYTPNTYTNLNGSPQKCLICGFVYVEASVIKYRTLPFSLTSQDLKDIKFNQRKLSKTNEDIYRHKFTKKTTYCLFPHSKKYQKNIPDSQSSIDDFTPKTNKEEK